MMSCAQKTLYSGLTDIVPRQSRRTIKNK